MTHALVLKGADKIPVEITGMDDPALKALVDLHGPEFVEVDGKTMAAHAAPMLEAPEPVKVEKPVVPPAKKAAAVKAPAKTPAKKKAKK